MSEPTRVGTTAGWECVRSLWWSDATTTAFKWSRLKPGWKDWPGVVEASSLGVHAISNTIDSDGVTSLLAVLALARRVHLMLRDGASVEECERVIREGGNNAG